MKTHFFPFHYSLTVGRRIDFKESKVLEILLQYLSFAWLNETIESLVKGWKIRIRHINW